jgi:hypothetical protein
MSKRNLILIAVSLLMVTSLFLAGCAPTAALASGTSNGAATAGNAANPTCTNCQQTNTSTGPGPAAQTGNSYGPGSQPGNGAGAGSSNGPGNRAGGNGTAARRGPGGGIALGPLSPAEVDGLIRAVQEEMGAQALYQSVLDAFGDVAPFNTIVLAEAQHLAALERQATKYAVSLPTFTPAPAPTFATLAEACQAGVDAEIADAALYDELMAFTTHSDLLQVYNSLQSASLNQHLPAFEACK